MQLIAAAEAALRVLIAAIIVGAGLPILYAFGVRQLAINSAGSDHSPWRIRFHHAIAYLSFTVAVLMVLLGLSYIIAHGFGVDVTFDGFVPVITR